MRALQYATAISLIAILLLTGCGSRQEVQTSTPEETIHTAFTALKELDMKTFNACTNNRKDVSYRLFTQLSQKRDNEMHRQFAQTLVEDFSWEIHQVEIQDHTAKAKVTLYNKDFSESVGHYINDLIQQMNEGQKNGVDISKLVSQTIKAARKSPEQLLPYLRQTEKTFQIDTTITLKQVEDCWQIQLDDSLCTLITGKFGGQDIEKSINDHISAVEALLNNNLDQWGVSLEKGVLPWSDYLNEDTLQGLLQNIRQTIQQPAQ